MGPVEQSLLDRVDCEVNFKSKGTLGQRTGWNVFSITLHVAVSKEDEPAAL